MAVAFLGACRSQPEPTPAPTPPPYPASWRYHTEEEWLVAQTIEAIAGMAAFASGHVTTEPLVLSVERRPIVDPLAARHFTVRLAPGVFAVSELTLDIDDHIWSPATHARVVRQLLPAAAWTPAEPATTDVAGALLDLRVESLERENKRISTALSQAPLASDWQQDAALLLAAFALREDGWHFADTRVALCRLAAHLAMARAAGDERPTNAGRLAEAALDALALRQAAAVAELDALMPATPAEAAWARALRMVATGDWRRLERPERASLLERLVYVRTLASRIGPDRAQAFLDRPGLERVPDWRRSMLGGLHEVTVEGCNRYGSQGLAEDEAEMLAVWRSQRGADFDPELWLEALQMDPAPSPVVREGGATAFRVLDLGLWSSFERRQVLGQLLWDTRCFAMYGLKKEEQAQAKASARDYGRLETYALAGWETTPDAASELAAAKRAAEVAKRRPDLVTATQWVRLSEPGTFGPPPHELPSYALWFDPYSPFGTAYDARDRASETHFRPLRNDDFKKVGRAQAEIAPYHYGLRFRLCQSQGGRISNPSLDVQEPIYSQIAEYDAWALDALAQAALKWSKPEKFRLYAGRLCDLDVERCPHLAEWLVRQNEKDEAAKVYRKWVASARDRVSVANDVEWLIHYEYDHGRKPEAYRLAREAAATYSAGGLEALAGLLERDGDLLGAEAYFRREWDRYETSVGLVEFYKRRDDPRLRDHLRKVEKATFPDGFVRVQALFEQTGAPRDGVLITGSSSALTLAGLRRGEVIVGLDDYRVQNVKQYYWIRSLGEAEAPMILDVWDGKRYARVHAQPEKRSFRVGIETYRPDTP